MPSMRQPPSAGCYGRLVLRGTTIDGDDVDSVDTATPRSTLSPCRRPPVGGAARWWQRLSSCNGGRCKGGRAVRWCLTNVRMSVGLLLFGLALSLGPGLHTLLAAHPQLTIDKSIKAFNIPNHIVTRRHDAFSQALADLRRSYSAGRGRRDVGAAPPPAQQGAQQKDLRVWDGRGVVSVPRRKWIDHIRKSVDDFYTQSVRQEARQKETRPDSEWRRRQQQQHYQASNSSGGGGGQRKRRSALSDEGITQAYRRWKMTLVYLAEGAAEGEDPNMFTAERLEMVHAVERRIVRHPGFPDFCYINYLKLRDDPNLAHNGGCAPLNSLLTYFYPSRTPDGTVHYDGLGSKLDRIDNALSFAMTRGTFFWYVDDKINSTYRKSRLLRSEVQFGAPLPGYMGFADRKEEQSKKFQDFVITYINLLETASTDKVQVLYGGNELFDYEVDATFWADVRLSLFTLAAIVVFMFVLTAFSLWLTCCGIISILLSFPLALFLYREVFGVVSLGILNGAAAFLIIGIGVDDVFVFINTFRQAAHMTEPGDRLLHTVRTAGKATFFTSFTTAAAFAANVASSIPAIHDFGLFMSLIVSSCWLMVVIVMPPAINLWARFFASCENVCYRRCYTCPSRPRLELPPDVLHFLDASSDSVLGPARPNQSEVAAGRRRDLDSADDDSDDVPLLQMEDVNDHEGGWPIYLGMLNQMLLEDGDEPLLSLGDERPRQDGACQDDPASPGPQPCQQDGSRHSCREARPTGAPSDQWREGCSLTSWMQAMLYHFVGRPVVRVRWAVLAVYGVVLVASVCLMTQLHTATRPPQLFHTNTNLQRIMDLAANFSDSGITCDECSGFFKETPVRPTQAPPHHTTRPTTSTTATKGHPSTTLPTSTTSQPSHNPASPPWKIPEGKEMGSRSKDKTTSTSTTTTMTPRPSTSSAVHQAGHLTPRITPPPGTPTPTTSSPPTHRVSHPKPPGSNPQSVDATFDPCAGGRCTQQQARPNLELGAVVHVVFGIVGIDRSNVSLEHVLTEKGTVEYDENFARHFELRHLAQATAVRHLCQICKLIANNTKLVKPNGSQCIPQYGIRQLLRKIPDCENLPENKIVNGHRLPARAIASISNTGVQWIAFAFETTTYKGQSYFTAYNEYNEWEKFIAHLKATVLPPGSPLANFYQTSDFWTNVMMEVVAVSSAIYGLILSMIICITAVAIFTGHIKLLLVVCLTIFGVISLVVAIFYLAGWEMGAVEAVSLSILVGSSVDYCVHVVEGYLLAGTRPPPNLIGNDGALRRWRTLAALSHIGVSITSSALTTIVAAVPLTRTVIQPFSKFGQIVTINTTVSIVYTLTACVALLSVLGPARHRSSLRATLTALGVTAVISGLAVLLLYILSRCGVDIPAPNGENLFH